MIITGKKIFQSLTSNLVYLINMAGITNAKVIPVLEAVAAWHFLIY